MGVIHRLRRPIAGPDEAERVRAVWEGAVLVVPPLSVDWGHLERSWMRSLCPWKGIARYYSAHADAERAANIAWSYPHPFPWIAKIKGHVAFSGDVEIRF